MASRPAPDDELGLAAGLVGLAAAFAGFAAVLAGFAAALAGFAAVADLAAGLAVFAATVLAADGFVDGFFAAGFDGPVRVAMIRGPRRGRGAPARGSRAGSRSSTRPGRAW